MNKVDTKAFIVTTGSYSDYEVVRVYLDRALAEEYVSLMGEDYRIEEFEITHENPAIMKIYTRWIDIHAESGEVIEDAMYSTIYEEQREFHDSDNLRRGGLLCERREKDRFLGLPPRVHFFIRSKDPERVRKVGGDKLAQEQVRIMDEREE